MKNRVLVLICILSGTFLQAQELEEYIQEAEKNNPEIQAFELRYGISKEKINEVNTLPNTDISTGYFVSEPETRTGAQKLRFSVKQMIPWFGTITARENYAGTLAESEYVDIAIAKRKLALSVSRSYYKLYTLQATEQVLVENIQLLNTYEQLALTSIGVGKASAVDVLRLQIRRNGLVAQKEVLKHNYLSEQSMFNTLLNQKGDTQVNFYNHLAIPNDDSTIGSNNLELHPELLKYDKLYESIEKSEILNQKEGSPNIGFGLDYVAVSERPNMDFNENGKDILMPMVSLSVPIFNKKHKSRTVQNTLRQEEIAAQKAEKMNRLKAYFDAAVNSRISARIQFNTQRKNLDQANNAEEILIKNYETGTIDFNDVLDIQELQLKFKVSQIESIEEYYLQSAIINYLSN